MDQKRNRKTPSWCGSRKRKAARTPYDARITEYAHQGHLVPPRSILKTPEQIVGIRESGKINIAVLDHVAAHIKAGMTTAEIDRLVFEKTRELGGVPAPLGYRGFPKSTCTSINEEVCHGIPADDVALKDGDIVNVDVSTIYNSYFSDSSRMFCIGTVSKEKRRLVDVARECVELGLQEVKPWGFLGDMGQAVHDNAKKHGYSVVREVGGHGLPHVAEEAPRLHFLQSQLHAFAGHVHEPALFLADRADDQHGQGCHCPGQGERLDDPHGGRRALRAVGNHGAGHGRRARSAGVLNFHGGRLPDPGEGGRPSISCTVSDTGRPPPFIEKGRESLPYHCRSDTERHTVL
nr:type I methionyl aminopeptidase [Bilophila wadsworthia]